jgi:hypothetical protein
MSNNWSGEHTFFVDRFLTFTAAGRAHMARRRCSRSEFELVEHARWKGYLLLTDATAADLAHAIPGWAGSGIVKQPFPGGGPGPGVRLLFFYRRRCLELYRPFVVLIRHGGRAALLAALLGTGRDFAPDELERITSVLKAHELEELVDATWSFRGSCVTSSALPDLAILPTVAFRLFETLLDIKATRTMECLIKS